MTSTQDSKNDDKVDEGMSENEIEEEAVLESMNYNIQEDVEGDVQNPCPESEAAKEGEVADVRMASNNAASSSGDPGPGHSVPAHREEPENLSP